MTGKPTFKLEIAPNTKADGTAVIYLRLTHKRKIKRIPTGVYVKPEHWNPKQQNVRGNANNFRNVTIYLDKWKQKAQDAAIKLQTEGMDITLDNYVKLVRVGEQSDDLIPFIEQELEKNRGKWGDETLRNFKSKFSILKEFRPSINMHKIDFNFLVDYQAFLEGDDDRVYNTAHSHLRFFRNMVNRAIKQGLTNNYPFKNFTMPDPKSKDKDFLNKEERNQLWDLLYNGYLPSYLYRTLHFFLIACYTGVRHGDWAQFPEKPIEDNMLVIKQSKKDGKIVRIPLGTKATKLINDLPEHYRVVTNKQFNKDLKEIMRMAKVNKHISTHCARHTFVIMCLNEAKIPLDMVAKFIDDSIRTVQKHYAQYLDSYKQDEISKLDAVDG